MPYYKQKQMIARVDRKGNILGQIERWEAHKKGILHKGFTLAILYNGSFLLQHRKHPLFDGVFDLTSSSHQDYSNGELEDTVQAAKKCLSREWKLKPSDISGHFKFKGTIYYKAADPKSKFTEHEICDLVEVRLKRIPEPNYEVAYGYSLVTKKELLDKKSRIYPLLAPWVKKMIQDKLI